MFIGQFILESENILPSSDRDTVYEFAGAQVLVAQHIFHKHLGERILDKEKEVG